MWICTSVPSARNRRNLQRAAEDFRAFRMATNPMPVWPCRRRESLSAIFHFQFEAGGLKAQRTQASFAPECRATLLSAS